MKLYTLEQVKEELGVKTNPVLIEFVCAMRNRRIAMGYTQSQLGKIVGVNKSRISKIESGDCNITVGTMVKISNALKFMVIINTVLTHE